MRATVTAIQDDGVVWAAHRAGLLEERSDPSIRMDHLACIQRLNPGIGGSADPSHVIEIAEHASVVVPLVAIPPGIGWRRIPRLVRVEAIGPGQEGAAARAPFGRRRRRPDGAGGESVFRERHALGVQHVRTQLTEEPAPVVMRRVAFRRGLGFKPHPDSSVRFVPAHEFGAFKASTEVPPYSN